MTIHERVTIQAGGLIEIRHPGLPDGVEADVVIQVEELPLASGLEEPAEGRKPIWQVVAEIGASLPEGAWDDVPTDLSKNLDHYLYGAPKREE